MTEKCLTGVSRSQMKLLKEIIRTRIPGKTVWAYGSRVTGKAGEISDLDLVVYGCNSNEIYSFKEALEESDLLFSVDVLNWESIPEQFKDNIKKKYMVLQSHSDGDQKTKEK